MEIRLSECLVWIKYEFAQDIEGIVGGKLDVPLTVKPEMKFMQFNPVAVSHAYPYCSHGLFRAAAVWPHDPCGYQHIVCFQLPEGTFHHLGRRLFTYSAKFPQGLLFHTQNGDFHLIGITDH